jgi:hypothetical protein
MGARGLAFKRTGERVIPLNMRHLAIAGLVTAGGIATGVAIGAGALLAIIELDDGRHDIFGPDLPPADPRPLPPRLAPVR